MEIIEIFKELNDNESFLKNKIGESFDIKYRHLNIPAFNHSEAFIVYISGMIDTRIIDETILEPLMKSSKLPKEKSYLKSSGIYQIDKLWCFYNNGKGNKALGRNL